MNYRCVILLVCLLISTSALSQEKPKVTKSLGKKYSSVIYQQDHGGWYLVNNSGVCSNKGKEIIKPGKYDSIERCKGYYKTYSHNSSNDILCGICNLKGEVVIAPIRIAPIKYIEFFDGYFTYQIFDIQNRSITTILYDTNAVSLLNTKKGVSFDDVSNEFKVGGESTGIVIESLKKLEHKGITDSLRLLYDGIAFHSSYNGWYDVIKDKKHGVCTPNGKEIIAPSYDYVSLEDGQYYYIKRDDKKGVCNLDGKEIIAPIYDYLSLEDGQYYYIKRDDKKGVCNLDGKEIIAPSYDYVSLKDGQYYKVKRDKKYGVCNLNGKEIIAPSYDDVSLKDGLYYELYDYAPSSYGAASLEGEMLVDMDEGSLTYRDGSFYRSGTCLFTSLEGSRKPRIDVQIKQTASGYVLVVNGSSKGTYKNIEPIKGGYQLSISENRYCFANIEGEIDKQDVFTNLYLWQADGALYVVRTKEGKYGIFSPKRLSYTLPAEYDMIGFPKDDFAGVYKNDSAWLVGKSTGKLIDKRGYDAIEYVDGHWIGSLHGYSSVIKPWGSEENPISEQLYDAACRIPDNQLDDKLTMFGYALQSESSWSYQGKVWNSLGRWAERINANAEALEFYKIAAEEYRYTDGEKNYKRLKNKKTLQTIGRVALAVTTTAATAYLGAKYGVTPSSVGTASGNYSSSSGSVQGGMSCDYYREMYARWESNAAGSYGSLTVTGYSVKNSEGQDVKGSAGGGWTGANYTGMKSNLRECQREMRKVREEARKAGCTIPQSNYETITVSY